MLVSIYLKLRIYLKYLYIPVVCKCPKKNPTGFVDQTKIIPFQFIYPKKMHAGTPVFLSLDKPNYLTSRKQININQVQNRFIKQSLIIYDS